MFQSVEVSIPCVEEKNLDIHNSFAPLSVAAKAVFIRLFCGFGFHLPTLLKLLR